MNIGMSCQLLNNEMNTFILRRHKPENIAKEISKAYADQKISYKCRENAVIVEGDTLTQIFKDKTTLK